MQVERIIGVTALALTFTLAACGPTEEERAANEESAVAVVEDFGSRLVHVSKLAAPQQVVEQIREQYTPYVTTLLLGGWISDPGSAPGRDVSSPWPARIEVDSAIAVGNTAYDIGAAVVYITSVEGDPVLRQPVRIRVVQGEDGAWRIAEWNPIN